MYSGPTAAAAARARRRKFMERARQRGQHTYEQWFELLVEFEYLCAACGTPHCDAELTKDHVVPISLGGSDAITNLQPLCQPCNSWKGTRIIDFRTSRRGDAN